MLRLIVSVMAILFSVTAGAVGSEILNATPYGVFGSVPFKLGDHARGDWQSATVAASMGLRQRCDTGSDCRSFSMNTESLLRHIPEDKHERRIAFVNSFVNGFLNYEADPTPDAPWLSPEQTISSGAGDCEDFALVKMAALVDAGIPSKDMFIIVLKTQYERPFHAILAVRSREGHFLILDNMTNELRRDTEILDYTPLMSFGSKNTWIHGHPKTN